MCIKNVNIPFKFFCYTDDSTYIDPQVKIIPFVDNNLDIVVYNKLFLFSRDFHKLIGNDNKCIFFDLDIVIKFNIDKLIEFDTDRLAVIRARWKDSHLKKMGFPYFDHNINSSCMIWKMPHNYDLWEIFSKDPDFYLNKYHNGMDPYLYYEQNQRGDLPREFFYSYMYGGDLKYTAWARDELGRQQMNLLNYFIDPIPIVLFNGEAKDKIERFKKYYED